MSLTIHSRASWGARKPNGHRTPRSKANIKRLYIHWPGGLPTSWQYCNTVEREHSALRGIQNYHIDSNGWTDIGYSHMLFPNWGRPKEIPNIYTARGAQFIPAATLDDNLESIAICVAMGPQDPLLESVESRLRSYVRWAQDYCGHELHVLGHRQNVAHPGATECPGPKLLAYVPTLDKV